MTATCNNIQPASPSNPPFLYRFWTADGTAWSFPNEDYFNDIYLPRFNRIDPGLAQTLYGSECLVQDYSASPMVYADPPLIDFDYNDELLYEISTDRIEACSKNNTAKRDELLNILITRSTEYAVTQEPYENPLGSFREQMQSFDCNVTYTKSWNGTNDGDVDAIWTDFINKYIECYGSLNPTESPTESPTVYR